MFKKMMPLVLAAFLFASCSSSPKLERLNDMKGVESNRGIGIGKTVWIKSASSAFRNEVKLEKYLGKSLMLIVQDEMAYNGFSVLERADMGSVMEEYAFSEHLGRKSLNSYFSDAQYTVFCTLTNMQINDSGIWIPIVLTAMKYKITSTVEVKVIDNITGRINVYSGSGAVTTDYNNFLLFFGDMNSNMNYEMELCIRLAIRDAVLKM